MFILTPDDFLTLEDLKSLDENALIAVRYSLIRNNYFTLKRFFKDFSMYSFSGSSQLIKKYVYICEIFQMIEKPVKEYYYMAVRDILWLFDNSSDLDYSTFMPTSTINEVNFKSVGEKPLVLSKNNRA